MRFAMGSEWPLTGLRTSHKHFLPREAPFVRLGWARPALPGRPPDFARVFIDFHQFACILHAICLGFHGFVLDFHGFVLDFHGFPGFRMPPGCADSQWPRLRPLPRGGSAGDPPPPPNVIELGHEVTKRNETPYGGGDLRCDAREWVVGKILLRAVPTTTGSSRLRRSAARNGENQRSDFQKMLIFGRTPRYITQTEDRPAQPTPLLAQEICIPWGAARRAPPLQQIHSFLPGQSPARFQIPHSRGWRPERTQEYSGEGAVRTRGRKTNFKHHWTFLCNNPLPFFCARRVRNAGTK